MPSTRLEAPTSSDTSGAEVVDERALRRARRSFLRRRWLRRWLGWRRLLVLAVLVGVVAGSVWLVLFSPVLAVAGVRVEGTSVLDASAVRRAAGVAPGGPLATADLDAIAARVEQMKPVKTVEVTRSWPDTVLISVTERTALGVVERDGGLLGMDRDGVLFRTYASQPEDLPLLRVSSDTGTDALAAAAGVVAGLPAEVSGRIAFVEVDSVDSISMTLADGRSVFWGSGESSSDKAEVIAALLEAVPKASAYDVSVPGQPTTRP